MATTYQRQDKGNFHPLKKRGGKPVESADVNHFAAQVQTCNIPDVANLIAVDVEINLSKLFAHYFNLHIKRTCVSS